MGGYRLEREVQSDSGGSVYSARDDDLQRDVFIHVVPASLDGEALERFRRMVGRLAGRAHPHLAAIHSLAEEPGGRFVLLEAVAGSSLRERLSSDLVETRDAVTWWRQVVLALEFLHAEGLSYGRLDPGDVAVTPDGVVKLTGATVAAAAAAMSAPARGAAKDSDSDECFAEDVRSVVDLLRAWVPSVQLEGVHESSAFPAMRELRRKLDEEIAAIRTAGRGRETRTTNGSAGNLPLELSTFIGRESECQAVVGFLSTCRVVTITGTGGVGKTRVALEVARSLRSRFSDGVWLIELASLTDGAFLPGRLAATLGIRDAPGRTPIEGVIDGLSDKRVLLVLDCCEPVLDEVADLTRQLHARCPGLHVISTSREPLGIEPEKRFVLGPLYVPKESTPEISELRNLDALRLFETRARMARPEFVVDDENVGLVAGVCRRVDGIPLAIELAAARLSSMSVPELLAALDERFRVLRSDAGSVEYRHRTLHALIEWSYDLLDVNAQRMLRYLSVFHEGWSLESAESVCAVGDIDSWDVLDLVGVLVEKSLVRVDFGPPERTSDLPDSPTRYGMLDTVREFASSRLEQDRPKSGEPASRVLCGLCRRVFDGPPWGGGPRGLTKDRAGLRELPCGVSCVRARGGQRDGSGDRLVESTLGDQGKVERRNRRTHDGVGEALQ